MIHRKLNKVKGIKIEWFVNLLLSKESLVNNNPKNKISLGRWSNDSYAKTNLKIDYANEDHCGVCINLRQKN